MDETAARPTRLRRWLGGLLFLVALLLAGAGFALLLAEESGFLTRLVRRELVARLGPVAEGVRIEEVKLRWFEPGVELIGVQLASPDGDPLLRLDHVHATLRPTRIAQPIQRVAVDGGWVRVSTGLLESLERLADVWDTDTSGSHRPAPVELPAFIVSRFQTEIDLELPDESDLLQVGSVELVATPRAEGGLSIDGILTPELSGAVAGEGAVRVRGTQTADGTLRVRAVAEAVPLESRGVRMPASLGPLPVEAFGGRLSLAGSATIRLGGDFEARGDLRARLFDARLQPRADDPWLEDLTLDLDSRLALDGTLDLWDRSQWETTLRLRTRWSAPEEEELATQVEVWGLFGKRVPRGAWARLFARAPHLPLDARVLTSAGAPATAPDLWEGWDAFSPSGSVDATADAILRRVANGDGTFRYPLRAAAWLESRRTAALCFRGFEARGPLARPGDRLGVPKRCTGLQGAAAVTFDPERARRWWIGIPRTEADAGNAQASGWAVISERDDDTGIESPYLDCSFGAEPFDLDDDWLNALAASPFTRDILRDYNPSAGRFWTRWLLHDGPETYGLTAQGDVWFEDAAMAWSPLPIPVQGATGRLRMRWARRAAPIDYGDQTRARGMPRATRAFGLAFEVDNRAAVGSRDVGAHVRGFVRDETRPDGSPPPDPRADPFFWTVDVDALGLGLRGRNAELVEAFVPEFGPQRDELEARGRIDVHYESAQPSPDAPYVAHVAVTPDEVEVTPRVFPRRTTDLTGRLLARLDFGPAAGLEEVKTDARAQLGGSWPQGVTLGAVLELQEDELRATVRAAGPDPSDPGLKGALASALARDAGEAGPVDLSESSFEGSIDFAANSVLSVAEPEAEADTQLEVYLRDCALTGGSLHLEGLHGRLDQADGVLRGERIFASLAGHEVLLEDVALFPAEQSAAFPESARMLDQAARSGRVRGLVTMATVQATDLPMDATRVRSVLGAEAAASLPPEDEFHALLDVRDMRVLLATSDEDQPVVVLSGALRPHGLSLTFGLPISIRTADVALREMVIDPGGVRAWASIENLDAFLADRELSDASMVAALVNQRLTVDNLQGTFVGGTLRSLGTSGLGSRKALGVDLAPPHRFDLALQLVDVHVDRLLRGVFQSSIADAGLLRGSLELSGTPEDVLGLDGRGRLRLTKGRLWSIPAARALFTRLGFPDTAVFDELDSRFEVQDGTIDVHSMLVKSSLLNLFGSGRLDLDGGMSFDLDVRYGVLDRLGLLTRLIYWLNRNLVRVAVRGDFLRPEVLIRSSLLELFGGKPEARERGLPLPEFAPLGNLF